jgi:hypothetical protein
LKGHPQNTLSIPKINSTSYQKINENFSGKWRNVRGGQGDAPLGVPPPLGSEGVTLMFSGKNPSPKPKNQMNFSIQTVSKTIFFSF